jgi:hypothetical protein
VKQAALANPYLARVVIAGIMTIYKPPPTSDSDDDDDATSPENDDNGG